MKSIRPCRLFGAYEALSGIKNHVILLHTVTGCHFASLSFRFGNSMADIHQTSTIINDKDIIVSGEASLRKAIRKTIDLYKPTAITVITGCVAEIVKDDVEAVIEEFAHEVDMMYCMGAGFHSDFLEGYEDTLLSTVKKYCAFKGDLQTVNVFGLLGNDYKVSQDIKALKTFFNQKINMNFIGHQSMEDLKEISTNSLNICLGRGNKACEFLKSEYGVSYSQIEYPYGLRGLKSMCQEIETHFGISFDYELQLIESETLETLKKVYSYLDSFYSLPIGVVGSSGKLKGMTSFLHDELGMDVELEFNTDFDNHYEDFIEQCLDSNIGLIFGSSFDQDIADQLQIPLIRYDYPVFDRVSLSTSSFIGKEGVINFVEYLLNNVMSGVKNRGSLYNEKDMFLW